jgi:hypothetical protein
MKKVISLTPEEEQVILEMRRSKEEAEMPNKIGFLKEDLYVSWFEYERGILCSELEKDECIKGFCSSFEPMPEGTKFVCFITRGREEWFTELGCGVGSKPKEWARKYLRDITTIKK